MNLEWNMRTIGLKNIAIALSVITLGVIVALPVQTRSLSSDVLEAQDIMTQFGLPTGPKDGKWGSQTARGICAFRSIAGLPISRSGISSNDMVTLRNYRSNYGSLNSIPAPLNSGNSTYLVANKTCQVMTYVESGRYVKVMPISTGKAGYETPNISVGLGYTNKGWSCSSLYPETCTKQSAGRFSSVSNSGNMYNKRLVSGAIYVHGSNSVPTSPASHGCIRVTVADSDWMYDHVGNNGKTPLSIVGKY